MRYLGAADRGGIRLKITSWGCRGRKPKLRRFRSSGFGPTLHPVSVFRPKDEANPISGLPEIGTFSAQVGQARLAMRRLGRLRYGPPFGPPCYRRAACLARTRAPLRSPIERAV